jgi:hypothetical protein
MSLSAPSIDATIVSVEPHVTVTLRSASTQLIPQRGR